MPESSEIKLMFYFGVGGGEGRGQDITDTQVNKCTFKAFKEFIRISLSSVKIKSDHHLKI